MAPYTAPELGLRGFTCPHCDAYSEHSWYEVLGIGGNDGQRPTYGWRFAWCRHCEGLTYWQDNNLIYPERSPCPRPNDDLPDEIKSDYQEARSILGKSPRGAAALFRLCIQKICIHLGLSGKNLNADIGALVKAGLNPKIQKSLDVVRVVGNEAVHPGTIDLRDDKGIASHLASLVNVIADAMITQPKLVDELFDNLPQTKKDDIKKRDSVPA